MNATATEQPLTGQERNEIILRLQATENTVAEMARQVNEIHGFAARLAETLDALGSNPMIAAMVPPGTFGEQE